MRNVERRTKRRGNRRDKSTFRILKFFLLWGRVLRSGEVATKFTRDNNNQFGLQTNQFYFPRFTAVVARFSDLHNARAMTISLWTRKERTCIYLRGAALSPCAVQEGITLTSYYYLLLKHVAEIRECDRQHAPTTNRQHWNCDKTC